MMALDDLSFVPQSDDEFASMSFSNIASHRDINRAIFQQFGVTVQEYPINPINRDNPGQWAWQHQQMHNQAWAALGGFGYNLLGVNWDDPVASEVWVTLHGDEHNRLEALLGL
jgi:hypothetical protein